MPRSYVGLEVKLFNCVQDPEKARAEIQDWLRCQYGYGDLDFVDIEVDITETTP
jgi:hypothetical protein